MGAAKRLGQIAEKLDWCIALNCGLGQRILGILRGHVLFGDQVHAIAQRCDERDIGVAVELRELGWWDRAAQIANRGPAGRREAPIHAPHDLIDLAFQPLVLGQLVSRWLGDRSLPDGHFC